MDNLQAAVAALKFGGPAVYPLLFLAVLATVIIIDKAYVYLKYVRLPADVLALVETYDFAWDQLAAKIATLSERNTFRRFFAVILENHDKPAWWVESRAGDEAQMIEKSLARGAWILETIVTAAPLLGLLGTIAGMMTAFKLIGGDRLVDPIGVTGGVAEALIATALGLFIALICLFAFNFFSRMQAQTLDDMERLGTRLIDHIRLDQQGQPGQPGSAS